MIVQDSAGPWVALSGERPDPAVLEQAAGVGMIRSEYLVRKSGAYLGHPACQDTITSYVAQVVRVAPGPVWYRLIDLEERDIKVLRGAPAIEHHADNPVLRLRGSSRWIASTDELYAELDAVRSYADSSDFGILVPYCHDEFHLAHVVELIRGAGIECALGVLIETPSAVLSVEAMLELVDTVLVGTNDLTTLTLGCQRQDPHYSATHPAVLAQIRSCLAAGHRAGKDARIAGNYDTDLPGALADLGPEHFVVHYCDWGSHVAGAPEDYVDRWESVRLRAESDQRLVQAGLLHESNLVAVAGIRRNGALASAELVERTSVKVG